MLIESKKKFIINFLFFIIVAAIGYLAIKYGLVYFMPFIIGFLIAFMLRPLIIWSSKKLKLGYKITSIIVLTLFYVTVGLGVILLSINLFLSLRDFVYRLPVIYRLDIEPALMLLATNVEELSLKLSPEMSATLDGFLSKLPGNLGSMVTTVSAKSVFLVRDIASYVPAFFISLIFTVVSTFFFTIDYEIVTSFILKQLSPKIRDIVFDIRSYLVGSVLKLLKAYAILMFITFLELSIGLAILRIPNPFLIAAIIAIVDILPVLGTGGVLIPWAIIELLKGNLGLAVGIIILYLVILVVRNTLEPRVVGDQIGLHPLIILISMFVGAKLFGVMGIFLLPLAAITIKKLNSTGKIKLFK